MEISFSSLFLTGKQLMPLHCADWFDLWKATYTVYGNTSSHEYAGFIAEDSIKWKILLQYLRLGFAVSGFFCKECAELECWAGSCQGPLLLYHVIKMYKLCMNLFIHFYRTFSINSDMCEIYGKCQKFMLQRYSIMKVGHLSRSMQW